MDEADKKLLEWARFVATKFQSSRDGWVYSRDLGGLKHLRYESDYTGYNHWTKRLRRAVDLGHLTGKNSFSRMLRGPRKRSLRQRALEAAAWVKVSMEKSDNLPDGQINGIITHWEEDGEYLAFFQPRVGAKVLDFIEKYPEHPAAQEILAELKACALLSFPHALDADGDEEAEADTAQAVAEAVESSQEEPPAEPKN